MKITTIVNYCTNEYVFLKPCIDAALSVSHEVIVPYCDHFLDGTTENRELLEKSIAENPKAQFIEFSYDKNQNSRWHHNVARKIGIESADPITEYILFLDTDEIIEPDRFNQWVKQEESVGLIDSYKIANYWYFRDVRYRSKRYEDSILLVKKGYLTQNDDIIFHHEERNALFFLAQKRKGMCMLENKPFIHHYSWVRTKEAMLKKVTAWGHSGDKDWVSLVHEEFSQPFRGRDLIFPDRNIEYEIVEPYIEI